MTSAGYVMLDYTPGRGTVTYPKFRTEYGTAVSVKEGIWDPASERYDRDRLKYINLPVLKPHSAGLMGYGATACIKNYMGLVSNGLTNSHDGVGRGLMGTVLAEIGLADLNILDCIWISGDPYWGPRVYYGLGNVTRVDELVASTDPIAADIWAVKNILVPTWESHGLSAPWPWPSADPDDPRSAFRIYIDNSMEALLEDGFEVTNDVDAIDVFSAYASRSSPTLRRSGRRVRP
jgi:hypothetical protein